MDHVSEEQTRHSREVQARVIRGVELTLGRHLRAGLLSELRIRSNWDTDAPLHGAWWWGWTQVHGMGHFSAPFVTKRTKSAGFPAPLSFSPLNHWSASTCFCRGQLWELTFIPLGWMEYVPVRFVPRYGQWQKKRGCIRNRGSFAPPNPCRAIFIFLVFLGNVWDCVCTDQSPSPLPSRRVCLRQRWMEQTSLQ